MPRSRLEWKRARVDTSVVGTDPLQQEQRLGEIMIERGLLSEEQLAAALAEQRRENRPLGELLVSLGYASSAAVSDALAEQKGWGRSGIFGFGNRLRGHLHAVPALSPVAPGPSDPPPRPALQPTQIAAVTDQEHGESGAALAGWSRARLDLLANDGMRPKADPGSDHAEDAIVQLRNEINALQQRLDASEVEREQLRDELAQQAASNSGRRRPAEDRHRLFVPTATGYRLLNRSGPPPEVGTTVELGGGDSRARYLVSKIARLPLPDATTLYVYLQAR